MGRRGRLVGWDSGRACMPFRVHRLWQGCWRELEVEVVGIVVGIVEAMRHIRVVRVGVDLWVVCRGGEL